MVEEAGKGISETNIAEVLRPKSSLRMTLQKIEKDEKKK
jgi:hypothetical protein